MKLCLVLLYAGLLTLCHANVQVVVKEGQDAVLLFSLSTKENIEKMVFDLKKDRQEVFFYNRGKYYGQGLSGQDKQFVDRVSHFNDELKNGNASIKIRETKVADNGNYTFFFPHLKLNQSVTIELVVEPVFKDRSGENPTASPKPYIETLNQTQDRVLLQCEVRGASPEPKLEWRDSSGNILPAEETQRSFTGGKYDLTIQANVTKSGDYFCVLKQEGIYHNISSQTFVPVIEKVCEDSSVKVNKGWYEGLTVGLMAVGVIFLAAVLILPLRWISSLRCRVIDFLSRLTPQRRTDIPVDPVIDFLSRLQPPHKPDILMDPEEPREPEQKRCIDDDYHDEDESDPPGSPRDSGITLQSLNGSTT